MPETVRVRIPVVVLEDGSWHARAMSDWGDSTREAITLAMFDRLDSTRAARLVTFIEADVPAPQATTVEGKAVASA